MFGIARRRLRSWSAKGAEAVGGAWIPFPPAEARSEIWTRFQALAEAARPSSALEVGTLQSIPGRPTHAMATLPWIARRDYVMADIAAGPDVDVVADLHALPAAWSNRFGVFLATAVFEHLERPWIAAGEAARVLAPGGLCMVSTHQTFPLHGYPQDFFRFSREALTLSFRDAGLEVIEAGYQHRCKIVPAAGVLPPGEVNRWNELFPSYVTVNLLGRKPESR